MDLSELKNRICESFTGTADDLEEVLKIVETDSSVFPFNEYEHLICNLMEKSGLTYRQYLEIRSEYVGERAAVGRLVSCDIGAGCVRRDPGRGVVARGQDRLGALAREGGGAGQADPLGRARDQDALANQL